MFQFLKVIEVLIKEQFPFKFCYVANTIMPASKILGILRSSFIIQPLTLHFGITLHIILNPI